MGRNMPSPEVLSVDSYTCTCTIFPAAFATSGSTASLDDQVAACDMMNLGVVDTFTREGSLPRSAFCDG